MICSIQVDSAVIVNRLKLNENDSADFFLKGPIDTRITYWCKNCNQLEKGSGLLRKGERLEIIFLVNCLLPSFHNLNSVLQRRNCKIK